MCKQAKNRITENEIIKYLSLYTKSGQMNFNKFCSIYQVPHRRRSLERIFKASGAKMKKESGCTYKEVISCVKEYLQERKKKNMKQVQDLNNTKRYLTLDEEELVVSMAQTMSNMGLGIDKTVFLDCINAVLSSRVEKKHFQEATMSVVDRLLKNHKDLISLMHGNAIDAARVRQAKEEVRNSFFVKLELYTQLLHKMKKIPWKTFADVPSANIFNMDEIATDTSKHRRKIIGNVSKLGRIFQLTPEGDGRMPFHITICLTTTATGKFQRC